MSSSSSLSENGLIFQWFEYHEDDEQTINDHYLTLPSRPWLNSLHIIFILGNNVKTINVKAQTERIDAVDYLTIHHHNILFNNRLNLSSPFLSLRPWWTRPIIIIDDKILWSLLGLQPMHLSDLGRNVGLSPTTGPYHTPPLTLLNLPSLHIRHRIKLIMSAKTFHPICKRNHKVRLFWCYLSFDAHPTCRPHQSASERLHRNLPLTDAVVSKIVAFEMLLGRPAWTCLLVLPSWNTCAMRNINDWVIPANCDWRTFMDCLPDMLGFVRRRSRKVLFPNLGFKRFNEREPITGSHWSNHHLISVDLFFDCPTRYEPIHNDVVRLSNTIGSIDSLRIPFRIPWRINCRWGIKHRWHHCCHQFSWEHIHMITRSAPFRQSSGVSQCIL